MTLEPKVPGPKIMAAFQAVSDDVFFVADPGTGELEYVGPGCDRVLGMSTEELLAAPAVLSDAVFPENGVHPEGPFETEFRFIRPDGEARWLRSRSYPVEIDGDGEDRVVGLIRDVTEQKLAARELRRSREEILELVGRIPDGILVATRNRILYANEALAQALAYDDIDALAGLAPADFVHPDDVGSAWERLTGGLASGLDQPDLVELRVRHRDGSWLSYGFTPVRVIRFRGRDGVLALVRNLSGERAAEVARRRAEARYQTIFDHAPLGVAMVRADGTMLEVNPALRQLLGWEDLNTGAVSAFDIVHADEQPVARDQFRRLVAGEIPGYTRNTRLLRKDGTFCPVRLHVSASPEGEGDEPLVITLVEDTSARLALEQQLRTVARMESIGRLAGGIAHDFNNLVTVINGHAEMILDETSSSDPHHEDLTDILTAGQRAAALTGQLLAFSRRTVLEPRILELNQVLDETRNLLARSLGEDIQLRLETTPLEHRIQMDRSQLEQIILNLVVNARDAMPTGGTLIIRTRETTLEEDFVELHPGSRPGQHVVLEVEDEGQGMSPELLDYIFEPFFTTKPQGSGTGLGLSTVYGIVKQSLGYIQVESEVGEGTTFSIYFPAREETPDVRGADAAYHAEGGHETILLAEDDEAVRSLAERVLLIHGYRVLAASDGQEGLELAAEFREPIDLVVTDVIMPRVGGRELVDRLRQDRPGLPVLFMSGYTDDALLRHGVRHGEVRMLYKPFSAQEFAATVREVLDDAAGTGRAQLSTRGPTG